MPLGLGFDGLARWRKSGWSPSLLPALPWMGGGLTGQGQEFGDGFGRGAGEPGAPAGLGAQLTLHVPSQQRASS